jgi:uncharacterized protein YndB with AHSA1/START domain
MSDPPRRRLGITITRVFDAPREAVWRELTQPESFADWFGGPEFEVPLDSVSMDVTPGGRWRALMLSGQQRREIEWDGEYLEVDEPERLVFTIADHRDAPYELVTIVLTDLGDGSTHMHFEQSGYHPPEIYEAAKSGWGVFFDRLEQRLVS